MKKINLFFSKIFQIAFIFIFVSSCQSDGKLQKKNKQEDIQNEEAVARNSVTNKSFNDKLDFHSIYVELFDNKNIEAGLNARLRPKLIHQYSSDGRLAVQRSIQEADLILSGNIETFALLPISYNPLHGTTRYQLQIVVTVYITPNGMEEKDYSTQIKNLILGTRTAHYTTFYSSQSSGLRSLEDAKEKLLEGVSRRIIHISLDNWYPLPKR